MPTDKIIAEIAAERLRQKEVEGWTQDHDDEHRCFEIAHAASCYAAVGMHGETPEDPPFNWPWDAEWWKPKDPRRDLIRAAALIVAELERMERKPEDYDDAD